MRLPRRSAERRHLRPALRLARTTRSSSSISEQRDRARQLVHEQICQHVPEVLPYSDFLVLDQKLALSIQPAVPIPRGYAAYWPVRPDARHVIDITLGVLLSDSDDFEILGYVALPRWPGGRQDRCASPRPRTRTELFGRCDLAFLQNLL